MDQCQHQCLCVSLLTCAASGVSREAEDSAQVGRDLERPSGPTFHGKGRLDEIS